MLEQRALELLVIKDLLVKIQFVLIFLVILGVIVNILLFRKKIKVIILSIFILFVSIVIYNHVDARGVEIKNSIELNSSFFGIIKNKVDVISMVKLNEQTNLIEKVDDIFFEFNGILGSRIISANYKVMDGGKYIRVKITTQDGSTKPILLESPNTSNKIASQEQKEFPEVDLTNEVILYHNSEIKKITHNILILSIVLGIDIIIVIVQFIRRYRKSITS